MRGLRLWEFITGDIPCPSPPVVPVKPTIPDKTTDDVKTKMLDDYDASMESYVLGIGPSGQASPPEMLPNLFAGLQRNGAKRTRKYRMNAKRRKLEDHDLRCEGYHLPKAEGSG